MSIKKHGGIFGRNPTFNDVEIEGDLAVDGSTTYGGDVTIDGDLTVNGTETIIDVVKLEVEDPNVLLGRNNTTDAQADGGGITLQGATNKTITWSDATDQWVFSDAVASVNGFIGDLTGDVIGTVSDISNHTTDALAEGLTNLYFSGKDTDDLPEGSVNLYYADALARGAFSAAGDLSYDSNTGEFSVTTYKSTDFDTDFSGKDTDDLPEGSTNLYYADALARGAFSAAGDLSYNSGTGEFSVTTYKSTDFDTDFSGKTTDNLTEGATNFYYADALVDGHLTGGTGVTYTTGTISIGQDVATSADVTFNSTQVADGLVGTPTYAFTNSPDTGLYRTAAGLLGVSVDSLGVVSYGTGPGEPELTVLGTFKTYEFELHKRVIASGTTGAQTINRPAGAVNFAAAATSLVVTNSLVTADSIIIATVATNDSTMTSVQAVATAGSFTLYANAAATAETRVNFVVIN